MQATEIKIKYNDDFDVENYPLEQWHRDAVATVHNLLGLADDVEWWYHATIHGGCYWVNIPCMPNHEDGSMRLNADEVKGLSEIVGLRWIEAPRADGFKFALSHKLPV